MKKLILSVVLANLLAACGSAPQKEAVVEPKAAAPQAAPAPEPTTSAASTPDVTSGQADADAKAAAATAAAAAAAAERTQADANASAADKARAAAEAEAAARAAAEAQANAVALAKRSVFFPFDVDAVQAEDRDTILAHAKNLSEHTNLKVRLEGNADERGSSEYNLALGQRRANNTRKALVLGGARSAQIETISYGEEKPLALGHDETAWAQNRRTDIVYGSGQ